jgi:5-hydroxyisourate hydrolase
MADRMTAITTHVLDVSRGCPAARMSVVLEARDAAGDWREVGRGVTDLDGRVPGLVADASTIAAGVFRLTFDTGSYFRAHAQSGFYPEVRIVFEVDAKGAHYHVPLLISPFGYTTYRGS